MATAVISVVFGVLVIAASGSLTDRWQGLRRRVSPLYPRASAVTDDYDPRRTVGMRWGLVALGAFAIITGVVTLAS